jgi:hypothetical protein
MPALHAITVDKLARIIRDAERSDRHRSGSGHGPKYTSGGPTPIGRDHAEVGRLHRRTIRHRHLRGRWGRQSGSISLSNSRRSRMPSPAPSGLSSTITSSIAWYMPRKAKGRSTRSISFEQSQNTGDVRLLDKDPNGTAALHRRTWSLGKAQFLIDDFRGQRASDSLPDQASQSDAMSF